MSAANFGNWPTPVSAAVLTMKAEEFRCIRLPRAYRERTRPTRARGARRGRDKSQKRACDFRRALKIEDPGALGDFPVRARLEIEFRRRAPAAHLDIRAASCPTGTELCGRLGTVSMKSG